MENNDILMLLQGVTSFLSFGVGYFYYKEKQEIKLVEEQLRNQRIYTPDELKNIIEKNEPLVHKLFDTNNTGSVLIGKNLLVQGQINNQDCLKSKLDMESNMQLVFRINYDFPYYNDEENYRIISEKTTESLYYLQKKEYGINQTVKIQPIINLQKKDTVCKVYLSENFQNIDKQCYDYHCSRMNSSSTSFLKQTWNIFGSILASIAGIFFKQNMKKYLCFKIKVDNCEIGIKNKGIISVLGDIVYNKDKGEFFIQKPLRLMKNKLEYLSILKKQIGDKDQLVYVFFFSSFVCATLSLRKLYLLLQHRNELRILGLRFQVPMVVVNGMRRLRSFFNNNNMQQKNPTEPIKDSDEQNNKALESVYTQPREQMECIICYQRSRSVIIRPCLHCSMCQQCYNVLPKKECPVCKTSIKSEVKIYQQPSNQINNPDQHK